MAIAAFVRDPDPDTLTFAWTASAGTIAVASAKATTYRCTLAGSQTVTVRVSDGQCDDSISLAITCVAPTGG